ncbi:hypothetical protein NFH47_003034 [Escherichia coli]|nr:hypothetical protein [Salmonella enterica]EJI5534773.1 hypothetical protein [Escherichia coli]EJK1973639.1 hypothetical protein [Salmonella enterica]
MVNVTIPDDIDFSDLRLSLDPDGSISFEGAIIERICEASGLPAEVFINAPEDNVSRLIVGWYQAHRKYGGKADPVAEALIAEIVDEQKAGQTFSYKPGRA